MIRINLIPPEYADRQQKRDQIFFLGIIGVALLIAMVSWYSMLKRKSVQLDGQIKQADADLKRYQATIDQIKNIEDQKNKLIGKRNVIKGLNSSRLIFPAFLEDLLPLIPSDVWVSDFKLDRQNGSVLEYKLSTKALSNFAVATLLSNLEQSTDFSNVKIDRINYEYPQSQDKDSQSILSFQLGFSYQRKGRPMPLSESN